jgi:hypothetical protein
MLDLSLAALYHVGKGRERRSHPRFEEGGVWLAGQPTEALGIRIATFRREGAEATTRSEEMAG